MISVDGRLQTRGWKDREGNNRVSIEILVDNAYFADSKKDDAAGDFPADDQFAGYGAYQGYVPGGGDDFAPDFLFRQNMTRGRLRPLPRCISSLQKQIYQDTGDDDT